jgi:UDP-2-acetamido-3-amino-2,3-dideoxy-glucuronate N-acetyltransferase
MVQESSERSFPGHDVPQIAVIGSGYWGRNLVRNYHQLGALRLICDKNETLLGLFQEQYPAVEVCLALNDVLKRDDIRGVAIATPAETHFALAREALLAGKHVYVEKPLVLHEREGGELIELAQSRNLVLMVGHLLQYHPAFLRLKGLAAQGKIRREENILWSFAPHDLSMILSIAGEEPECVLATGGNYLHRKIADVTTTHLEFPSGLRAHIFVSWLHPFKEQKLVVVGDRRMAVFDDTQPWPEKLLLFPHEIKWQNNVPLAAKAEPERIEVEQTEPLRGECAHFLECIATGRTPITDGHEGLRVLRILNAGQRSLDGQGIKIALGRDGRGESAGEPGGDTEAVRPPRAVRAEPPAAPLYVVHPTAVIDESVTIGAGTKIWHFSHVLSHSRIGERCTIGQNVVIGPKVTVGDGCKIQNNVSLYQGVTLEDDVFCGPSMVFTNVFNPRAHVRRMEELRPTVVKKGATLGANCTVVCGNTIGRYAFIGAGAVVTRDVADHALMVGNPARRIGWMCECGEKLDDSLRCARCGKEFAFLAGRA